MGFTLKPAISENFVNREALLSEMIDTLQNRNIDMGFALVGPRRVGKTSILREVNRRLNEEEGIISIYCSVWDLVGNTLKEFTSVLTRTILSAFKRRFSVKYKMKRLLEVSAEKLYEFLKTAGITIKILDEIEVGLSLKEKTLDVNSLIDKPFLLTEELAAEFNVRVVLIIDEFPSLTELTNGGRLGEGIIKKIRTINETLESTVLCISGSIKKTMETTVLTPSSAFYRQFIVKKITPFDESITTQLLRKHLGARIKEAGIKRAFELTGGIPFYLQLLGRQIEREKSRMIDDKLVSKVFFEVLEEEGNIIFNEEFYRLSDKERLTLEAMVSKGTKRLNQLAEALKEGANVVSKYLEHLINKGIIERKERGIYRLVDPVFEVWLSRRFR